MNQPEWNIDWCARVFAPKTNHNRQYVVMSKIELIGPMKIMNRAIPPASHFLGSRRYSSSMRSHGIEIWEMSYNRFCTSKWMGNIGRNGRNALAASTLKTLPKLELAVI